MWYETRESTIQLFDNSCWVLKAIEDLPWCSTLSVLTSEEVGVEIVWLNSFWKMSSCSYNWICSPFSSRLSVSGFSMDFSTGIYCVVRFAAFFTQWTSLLEFPVVVKRLWRLWSNRVITCGNEGLWEIRAEASVGKIGCWDPNITFLRLSSWRTSKNTARREESGLVPNIRPHTSSSELWRPHNNLKTIFCSTIARQHF